MQHYLLYQKLILKPPSYQRPNGPCATAGNPAVTFAEYFNNSFKLLRIVALATNQKQQLADIALWSRAPHCATQRSI